jgi:hypothetical protein
MHRFAVTVIILEIEYRLSRSSAIPERVFSVGWVDRYQWYTMNDICTIIGTIMRGTFVVILGLIYFNSASSQTHEWSFSFGGTQFERAYGIEVDPTGNVYVCGAFDNTVDFDPDSIGTAIITEEGNGDVYLAKYSNSGEHIWSHNIGSWGHDLGSDMAVDNQGNIYLTGYFRVDVDFDLGPDTAIVSALGTRDLFVVKYNTNGDYQWAFNIAAGGNVERYPGIGLDPLGNVLVTGEFGGTQDFDPGAGVATITSNGDRDVFIAKYDNSGNFHWARAMGGIEFDWGRDIAADSQGDIYVTGAFRDVADMDGGPGTASLTSNGGWDGFLVKYSAAGNYIWSHGFGGGGSSSDESGMDLAIDSDDNVLLVGYYRGNPDMDPGAGQALLPTGLETNGYLAKYDASGSHLWSFGLPDAGDGQANSVAVDPTGQVYITGYFEGVVDFDPGLDTAALVGWDIYVAKYTDAGDYVWAMRAGDSAYDGGWGIAVDDTANVYVTGVFYGLIDLDPDTTEALHDHVGGRDVFVAKYSPCYRSLVNADFCAGDIYILPNGSQVSTEGIYPVSYNLPSGCDSVITVFLTEISLDTSLTPITGGLVVAQAGAQYQWIDCINGNLPVTGATDQSFIPTISGSYAVTVQANGCVLTSSCAFITSVGFADMGESPMEIYPNPTDDIVYIRGVMEIANVRVYDATGTVVPASWAENVIQLNSLPDGIYHVEITQVNGARHTQKLMRH